MAWNEDGWRLARTTFDASRHSIDALNAATAMVLETQPEVAQRIERAMGVRSRQLAAAAASVRAFGELPPTEPEARRAIAACQAYKTQLRQFEGYLSEQARAGRQGLTMEDRAALWDAGLYEAMDRSQQVPWSQVTTLMRVPQAGAPAPSAPRDPTRTRRSNMQALLPLAFMLVIMFSQRR